MQRAALLRRSNGAAAPLAETQAAFAAARDGWLNDPANALIFADFARYGGGAALDECPQLRQLFAVSAAAKAFAALLVSRMLPLMRAHMLGAIPLRHGSDAGTGTLLLAREGRALLLLVAREPGARQHRVAGFGGGDMLELVLAGAAGGRVVRHADPLETAPCRLEPGTRSVLDLTREALIVDDVETRLISLRLVRLPANPAPTCEYALETGELLHRSAGDPVESRHELMLALLGRMNRLDAVPVMAEMTQAGSENLRWQALRETIALDTATGVSALRSIARDAADTLNSPAKALLAQLCETYPILETA